mgnify:FL=1
MLRNSLRAARVPALARSYATELTQSSASGVKTAAFAEAAPTGSISVLVKAGTRYETAPGLAAVLKSSVFKVSRSPSPPDQAQATERKVLDPRRELAPSVQEDCRAGG